MARITPKRTVHPSATYVFDVAPLVQLSPAAAEYQRYQYWQGRIWVDQADTQIVRARGKYLPDTERMRYPVAEVQCQRVEDLYWFPSVGRVDEVVSFASGTQVHTEQQMRYTEFRRFRSDVTLIEVGEAAADEHAPAPAAAHAPAPGVAAPVRRSQP